MPKSTQILIIMRTDLSFMLFNTTKLTKKVVNINLKVVKHNKATVLAVSKMSQNKIMLKTLNGNISSTMYAATSLFISALVTCC